MEQPSNKNSKIKIAVFSISFVLSIAILSNLFSNPLDSSKSISYLFLLVLFAICINLGLSILKDFVNLSQSKWVFYIVRWTLTFIIPISLIVLIEHPLQKKIMADVSKSMKPTLKYIEQYKKDNGILPVSIKENGTTNLNYYHAGKFYMLSRDIFPTASDKETIYFNSKDNKWYRFHNDQYKYYKDKKVVPPNLKEYIWFVKKELF